MGTRETSPYRLKTLVVIPARGGSKGIPRKSLRPLRGKPLVAWTIEAALKASRVDRVVVSTDSEEIAAIACRFGAEALLRDQALAGDEVTLDPVVHGVVTRLEEDSERFELVLTVQPTSPLLRTATIDRVVERMLHDASVDTILTEVDNTHLARAVVDGQPCPTYKARLNRQELPVCFRECGAILATRRQHVHPGSRIGTNVALEVLDPLEGIDINGPDDWLFAEAALGRRRIAFVVVGTRQLGLGHVTRVMTLMECMSGHVTQAFCMPDQDVAIERLRSAFFPLQVVEREQLLDALKAFGAETVIHDELDTSREQLCAERDAGMRIVCFEDRGAGLEDADLVFNALYPAEKSDPGRGHFYGPEACVLDDEMLHAKRRKPRDPVERVLITFGGTDPSRLSFKVLEAIAPVCPATIVLVAGKGFDSFRELEKHCARLRDEGVSIELHRDVRLMSDILGSADIAFSSAGRTLYELAYMQVPSIVLAQNELELEHTLASPRNGFLFLGLGAQASENSIRSAFQSLLNSAPLRDALRAAMQALDLTSGRARVIRSILEP